MLLCREFVQIDAPDYTKRESLVGDGLQQGEDRDHVRFVLRPETYNGHITNSTNEL